MPKKEPVQSVNQTMSIMMDLRETINNVSDVDDAESDLFGNVPMSKSVMNFPGSGSGSKKAIPLEDSLGFPATAPSRSSKSKIIGFINPPTLAPISPESSTSSTTGLISDEITVLSPS